MARSAGADDAPALSVMGAGRRYGNAVALAPTTLEVKRGEAVALLGPSGSGKTTMIMLMAGELAPTEGRVLVHGIDLAQMRPGRQLARLVGVIHQQFDLVPNLSALQNALAGRLGEWRFAQSMVSLMWPQDKEVAMDALARMGVGDRADLRASRLSGGEQQRVAIARLLLQDPAIVLADEPVSSLDPARAEEIVRLLVGVTHQSQKTLVASVHSVQLARQYFQRLVGLRNGAVQFDQPAEKVTDGMLTGLYALQGLRGE